MRNLRHSLSSDTGEEFESDFGSRHPLDTTEFRENALATRKLSPEELDEILGGAVDRATLHARSRSDAPIRSRRRFLSASFFLAGCLTVMLLYWLRDGKW